MGDYSDTATILEGGILEIVWLGVNYLDSHKIDTNPEAVALYEKALKKELKQLARTEVRRQLAILRHLGPIAARALLTVNKLDSRKDKEAIFDLLKVKNFKSAFRKSLCEQVLNWVKTPRKARKYNRPLSPRQMDSLTRFVR